MPKKKIIASTRQELVVALRERYQVAARVEKAHILSKFVAVRGYHRKHAILVLTGTAQHTEKRASSRPSLYDEAGHQAHDALGGIGPPLRQTSQAAPARTRRCP